MAQTDFKFVTVEKAGQDSNIYIITLNKPPENRLNAEACQEIIGALRVVVSARHLVVEGTFLHCIFDLLHQNV